MSSSASPNDQVPLREPAAEGDLQPKPDSLIRVAAWFLKMPLTGLLCVLAVVQLAMWIPHYLTWPLWSDHDVFATLAHSWHEGRLPYRDLPSNNFPGTIYLFWILGTAFGWGRSLPLYATDAGFVVVLGVALALWSRRRFASILPGVIGYLTFLSFYLGLDYSLAAQRDWHGPFFAVLGLLVAQACPGRRGRFFSALALAVAAAFRPQVVVLFPAVCLAIDDSARQPRESLGKTVIAMLAWVVTFSFVLGLLFAPLIFSGLITDFARGIRRTAYGGGYNRVTPALFVLGWLSQAAALKLWLVPCATLLLSRLGDSSARRMANTWLLAMAGISLYRPLSPFAHAYLTIPLTLVWSVAVAVLVGIVIGLRSSSLPLRLTVVLLSLSLGINARPPFCLVGPSRRAIATRFAQGPGSEVPPGYRAGAVSSSAMYPWQDYSAVLDYIRNSTRPETLVANALKGVPAITGSTARLSAFPAESLAWLWMVDRSQEAEFASALARDGDTVVVWIPGEVGPDPTFVIDKIEAAIKEYYQPEARFGAIEVWRRKLGSSPR